MDASPNMPSSSSSSSSFSSSSPPAEPRDAETLQRPHQGHDAGDLASAAQAPQDRLTGADRTGLDPNLPNHHIEPASEAKLKEFKKRISDDDERRLAWANERSRRAEYVARDLVSRQQAPVIFTGDRATFTIRNDNQGAGSIRNAVASSTNRWIAQWIPGYQALPYQTALPFLPAAPNIPHGISNSALSGRRAAPRSLHGEATNGAVVDIESGQSLLMDQSRGGARTGALTWPHLLLAVCIGVFMIIWESWVLAAARSASSHGPVKFSSVALTPLDPVNYPDMIVSRHLPLCDRLMVDIKLHLASLTAKKALPLPVADRLQSKTTTCEDSITHTQRVASSEWSRDSSLVANVTGMRTLGDSEKSHPSLSTSWTWLQDAVFEVDQCNNAIQGELRGSMAIVKNPFAWSDGAPTPCSYVWWPQIFGAEWQRAFPELGVARDVLPHLIRLNASVASALDLLQNGAAAASTVQEAAGDWYQQTIADSLFSWGPFFYNKHRSGLSENLNLLLEVMNGTWVLAHHNHNDTSFWHNVLLTNRSSDQGPETAPDLAGAAAMPPFSVIPMMNKWMSEIDAVITAWKAVVTELPAGAGRTFWFYVDTPASVRRRAQLLDWIQDNHQKLLYLEDDV